MELPALRRKVGAVALSETEMRGDADKVGRRIQNRGDRRQEDLRAAQSAAVDLEERRERRFMVARWWLGAD